MDDNLEAKEIHQFIEEINLFTPIIESAHPNAELYYIEDNSGAVSYRISFVRNHRELYNKLLMFCAEHNYIVVKTIPDTHLNTWDAIIRKDFKR